MKILVLLLLLTVSECEQNVTGRTGQNITLPCKYDIKINGPTKMCWGRRTLPISGCSNQLLATDGHKVIEESRASSRYQLQGRLDEGDVSLTIMNVTEEDAGLYGCRVEIFGLFNDEKHYVHLTVNRAPRLTSTPSSDTTSSSSDIHQTTAATPTSEPRLTSTPSSGTTSSSSDIHQTTAAIPTSGHSFSRAAGIHQKITSELWVGLLVWSMLSLLPISTLFKLSPAASQPNISSAT